MTSFTRCASFMFVIFAVLVGSCVLPSGAAAQTTQPAGRQWVVDQKNPRADDAGPGTPERPFKTIAPAAQQAQPNDTVYVHAGLYRERINPACGGEPGRPITYQAEPGQKVIVTGSEIWSPAWKDQGKGVYFAAFDSPIFAENNPFLVDFMIEDPIGLEKRPGVVPTILSTGQLFVDGVELQEVLTAEALAKTPGSYRVDRQHQGVDVHFVGDQPPKAGTVEASVRGRLFGSHHRGLGYITVRDFVFEHCANTAHLPQVGAVSPRSGHHWIIANNTVRFARSIGIECGSETWKPAGLTDIDEADRKLIFAHDNLIQGNTISDCGFNGIAGWNHRGTRIIGNIVERNDALAGDGKDGVAGIRLWNCEALVEGNLVRDNHSWGIWLDNGWDDSRITRNVVVNNRSAGVFMELCKGPGLIDHNLIGLTKRGGKLGAGFGIYAHDASGITIANNLIWGNAANAILMRSVSQRMTQHRGEKEKAVVETSNERIVNNLLIGQAMTCLPFPNARSHDNVADWNVFATAAADPFAYNWNQVPVAIKKTAEQKAGHSLNRLNFEQWKQAFSVDEHSVIAPDVKVSFDAKTLRLTLHVPAAVAAMRCPAVPQADRDFLGHDVTGPVPPGPISDLPAGVTSVSCWPIAVR
jgi:parallel beta-helix repeat protein